MLLGLIKENQSENKLGLLVGSCIRHSAISGRKTPAINWEQPISVHQQGG
jgi:hypothetical protein